MGDSSFKIYGASAGSGKTYALAKEYLKLLLSNDSPVSFRQILAITFTNKAVDEMKTRILENLYAFGKSPIAPKQLPLFQELCQELSLTEDQLRQKSKLVLKRILHNYSFFEVSTIDKFNHKLIKTFARDLRLSQNFEVELDTDLLLEESVGRLLERAGTDEELTEVLIDFSLEKIDDDKSWNIATDLLNIGKLIFQENHAIHLDSLREKSMRDFQEIKKQLITKRKTIEEKVKQLAQNVLQEIQQQGFELTDFPSGTLPNHFIKISEGFFDAKKLYNNKLEENLRENKKILYAKDKRDSSILSSSILEQYLRIKQNLWQLAYLGNIYGNIVPLTVLNEIAKEIRNIEQDKDIVPISALNAILSKEIKNQPVPFIYERMGEKYRHYFIDEFQDTSQMQWENLVPLIGNALESEDERHQKGSLFLVGDVKQAIYRWRGGRAEQFLNLINGKSHPFVVEPAVHSLDTNWRSSDHIVEFNNSFFTATAPVLQNEAYRNLFLHDSHQKTNNKPGGYIQLSFLDNKVEDKNEVYCRQVLETIYEISLKKHPYSDICILVRDNKNGMLLADFLAQHKIPIISSDALLLDNNDKITFLIALLKLFENANDREAAYQILLFLAKEETDKHSFIAKNIHAIEAFLTQEYGFQMHHLKGQSVFTILENAIVQFELATDSTAYLTFLMDEVLLVEKRQGSSIFSFLNYWEQKKSSLSIAAPDNVNAVRIMTIHKAKGLEFPFVIFPFANALLDDKRKKKKSWVPATDAEKELGLDEFLINTNKDMLEYNDETAQIYLDEEQKSVLDAMNVLYVALTRPIQGLFVITETGKEAISMEGATSYSDLFQAYLQQQNIPKNGREVYTFGSFPEAQDDPEKMAEKDAHIDYITRPKNDVGFTIATTSGRLWDDERKEAIELGNLIHFALSKINYTDEVEQVVENLQLEGHFEKDASEEVKLKLMDVVTHSDLKPYFSKEYKVINEREILTTNGVSLRPDRIAIKGNEAIIIDYKTGKPSPSHKEQITQYADVLKAMGFTIKNVIIVYIDHIIKPVFV
ncbi:UvrD-helicase domain-containing protein [Flagellimonas iocasae]|uniref:DNA 3'-5' helicase n=1 Tax=Flagellimonas iocasae TaxID=2055905 RepID=A0ABW4XYW5_9FLAO